MDELLKGLSIKNVRSQGVGLSNRTFFGQEGRGILLIRTSADFSAKN